MTASKTLFDSLPRVVPMHWGNRCQTRFYVGSTSAIAEQSSPQIAAFGKGR